MGCLLKRILLCLQKNRNNRIHPIDEVDYNVDTYENDSIDISSENRNSISRRDNYYQQNIVNTDDIYDGLSTREIISLINVIDGHSNNIVNRPNTTSSVINSADTKRKKKKSNKTCPICLEKIKTDENIPKVICKNKKCRGCYHKNCIEEWAKTKMTNDIACLLCTLKTIKVSANQSQVRRNTTVQYNPYSYNNNYSIYNNYRNNSNNLGRYNNLARYNNYNRINTEEHERHNSNRYNRSNYDINYNIYSNYNRTLNTR